MLNSSARATRFSQITLRICFYQMKGVCISQLRYSGYILQARWTNLLSSDLKFLWVWDSVQQKLLIRFLTELFKEDIYDIAFLKHGWLYSLPLMTARMFYIQIDRQKSSWESTSSVSTLLVNKQWSEFAVIIIVIITIREQCEVLWWVFLSVCLSVCSYISETTKPSFHSCPWVHFIDPSPTK